ncbi:MAG: hypothetical protein B6241_05270 [Spirochaetaceae bacterium 4572_59]|nr:MAG: hypothetical protein B6241_05270 [Spirochaetaceae bacterium 4572_59]
MTGKYTYLILLFTFNLFYSGCTQKMPSYSEKEKAGEVPIIEMEIPSDHMKEIPDVAAIVHDLRLQISSLEKSFSGEDPTLKKSLIPIEKSLEDLNTKLEGMDSQIKESSKVLQEVRDQLDTLREEIQE